MKNTMIAFLFAQFTLMTAQAQMDQNRFSQESVKELVNSLSAFEDYEPETQYQLRRKNTDTAFFPPNYESLKSDQLQQFLATDGTETGNGGFVRICEIKYDFEIQFADVADLKPQTTKQNATVEDIIAKKLTALAALDEKLFQQMTQSYNSFQQKNRVLSSADDRTFPDYQAAGHLYQKVYGGPLCHFIQLFSRVSTVQDKKVIEYLLLQPELFSALSSEHQAAAIFHEILYDLFAKTTTPLKYTTVFAGVMDLNQFIFTLPNDPHTLPTVEIENYQQQLRQKLELYSIEL